MAFNSSDFAKSYLKSPAQKIVDSVVGKVTSGLSSEASSVAGSISKTLFDIGASYDSVFALSSLKTDSLVKKGSTDYFIDENSLLNQKDVTNKRLSKVKFSSVNPNEKMAETEKNEEIMFISVI